MYSVAMYKNQGGLQVLSKFSGDKMVPVLPHELYANEERNGMAVDLALAPLIRRVQ